MRAVPLLSALAVLLSGCVVNDAFVDPTTAADAAVGLVPVEFLDYHLSAQFNEDLLALEARFPQLVDVLEIGRSVQGRPILLATLTNEALRSANDTRPIAFVDGCHHGNEIQGCEAPLFAAHFLAENYGKNAEVTRILDEYEVHVVPTVNPDGRDLMTRVNANGVNLNRNYPPDHGNPLGLSYPVGAPVSGQTYRLPSPWVPEPAASAIPGNVPFQRPVRPSENGGWAPLDQPETRAIDNWLTRIQDRLALYLTYHTSTHSVIVPWGAMNEPFPVPPEQDAIFVSWLDWVNAHTTYKGGRIGWGDTSGNLSYAASGTSMDSAYMKYGVFSTTVETFVPLAVRDDWPNDVDFWGASSLVFTLKILSNTGNLKEWREPTAEFPYPAEWTGKHFFPDGPPGREAAGSARAEL